jgi:hypothetical protein
MDRPPASEATTSNGSKDDLEFLAHTSYDEDIQEQYEFVWRL